ncbi:MAG: TspO/MBR family protein [Azospirillaceae bacterium]
MTDAFPTSARPSWLAPLAFAAVILAIGFVIGWSTGPSVTGWYPSLDMPFFQPPNWAFPVAWTLLYIAMGVAAGLVANRPPSPARRTALILFAVQLVFNFAWSPVFFGARSIIGGLAIVSLLLLLVAATTIAFLRLETRAGVLMLPYLAWVAFAALLNGAIAVLN